MLARFMAAGISLGDFQRLTPAEAAAVMHEMAEQEERRRRDSWERCRTAAVYSLLPHLKKGASRRAADLLPLPWDMEPPRHRAQGAAPLTRERYRRLTGEGG